MKFQYTSLAKQNHIIVYQHAYDIKNNSVSTPLNRVRMKQIWEKMQCRSTVLGASHQMKIHISV